ncbi:hypothetical protein D9758_008257 [Tetrapyrgos nigripes]|uniref:Glucose-methanol-choline oxidoreductase N-terminal domain-containing protein n=1 Tax=Tetrapyrgos nigripes TaxID=182062 RepID=A0A8H5G1M2_9AGAR|nr:hypothetical protein D9758_008257 [Tetrapyrgos nigripes]
MPVSTAAEVAGKSFDFVVVGGGTAGLAVAARISENPDVSVLVLEAGAANFDHPLITKSSQHAVQFGNPDLDWGFQTIPQKHGLDMIYYWNRGKSLGGSSTINFQCWTHPSKNDIDNWEKLGNPGWNWDMYEKYVDRVYRVDPAPRSQVEGWKIWDITKSSGSGIPKAPNPYHGNPNGVSVKLSTFDPQTFHRCDSATAYLRPNLQRPNLTVVTSALVHKLVLDQSSTPVKATGVEFSNGNINEPFVVNIQREVVICSGALKSSQILELSGIGRRDVLREIGVPVKVELPGVGENVQEHQVISIAFELKADSIDDTWDIFRDEAGYILQGELLAQGKGSHTVGISNLTYTPLSTFTGMERAKELYSAQKARIEEDMKAANVVPGLADQYKLMLESLNPEKDIPSVEICGYPGYISFPKGPEKDKKYYSICMMSNHNFGRGTIHATSSDPSVQPAMDPHYFEHDYDTQSLVEGVRFARKIAETEPFKHAIDHEHSPGPEVQTQEQLEEWIKKGSTTVFHTIGSCSMLPLDKNGVVDTNLKVYGTANVRVADLSIVPLHIAAHTQATAYTIGERAADIIRETLKN